MALTLNKIVGFETGGLEESSSTSGTPDATEATVVNSGGSERSLKCDGASTQEFSISSFNEVADAGGDYIVGFAVRFGTGVTPTSITQFFRVIDNAGANTCLSLALEADGDVVINNDSGSIVSTFTTPVSADTWHYFEVYFQHTASAAWEVFIDGVSVGSNTGADFLGTGSISNIQVRGQSTLDGPVFFDDIYMLSGATAASDRLGHTFHVRGFQSGAATTTSDYDIVTGGTGVANNWSNAGERALNTTNIVSIDGTYAITYNDTNSGGAGPGINSGSGSLPTANNQVVGAKWWWHVQRSNGANRTHQTARGNSGDGATTDTGLNSVIDTAYINYFLLDEDTATPVPLITEDFVQGFGQTSTSGQDTETAEQMAMIAWVSEPTQPTLSALSDGHMGQQNSYHGPFEKS